MALDASEKPIGAFYYHWQYTRPPTLCGMVEWQRHLRVDIHPSRGEMIRALDLPGVTLSPGQAFGYGMI